MVFFFLVSWLARTDPKDVARVESKTVIVTDRQRDTVPIPLEGAKGQLGNWMSPQDFDRAKSERFPGCMKGLYIFLGVYLNAWMTMKVSVC